MRIPAFLLAIVTGRLIRFGILSMLTVIFGPQIVTQTRLLLRNHLGLAVLGLLVVIGAAYLVFRLMRAPVSEMATEIQRGNAIDNQLPTRELPQDAETKMPRVDSPGK